jgi:hypothetical protein
MTKPCSLSVRRAVAAAGLSSEAFIIYGEAGNVWGARATYAEAAAAEVPAGRWHIAPARDFVPAWKAATPNAGRDVSRPSKTAEIVAIVRRMNDQDKLLRILSAVVGRIHNVYGDVFARQVLLASIEVIDKATPSERDADSDGSPR